MSQTEESGFVNLSQWASRRDPNGGTADVINTLTRLTPELNDIPWVEGNLPTGHKIVSAANALPSAGWRTYNAGADKVSGETESFEETVGMLEAESVVDCDLAKLNGDAAAFRASEDKLITEGIGQQAATSIWYESAFTNPERIHGLTPRYKGTSGYRSSSYVLKGAGGTPGGTDGYSVWLVSWEPRKLYGIYPKGSMAGLNVRDMGEQRVLDSSGKSFLAYSTRFQWKFGIAVEDYRYAVRFQYDDDDSEFTADDRGMYLAMQDMLNTIYKVLPSTKFYMSRTAKKLLDKQLASNDNNFLTYVDRGGLRIPTFMGVDIRVVDSLGAETVIS
jgi:hypothetical protein